jgi:L-lactate dehydrogenase complex protein LldG
MSAHQTIELFIKNAAAVAAEPVRVSSDEELNEILARILDTDSSIYCPCVTEREKAVSLPAERFTDDYVHADVCIEEVEGAIAETGSLICTSKSAQPVQAGLLTPHHVAIVSAANIYEKLEDFFNSLGDSLPTNITLETGPSRTADIELTLTIGVHGPGRLTVIVY